MSKKCYANYRPADPECVNCDYAAYCRESAENDRNGDPGARRADVEIDVLAALEKFADLPAVCDDGNGGCRYSYLVLLEAVRFLSSLSKPAFQLFNARVLHPEWKKRELAKMLHFTTRHLDRLQNEIKIKMENIDTSFVVLIGPLTDLANLAGIAFEAYADAEEKLSSLGVEVRNPADYVPYFGADPEQLHLLQCACIPKAGACVTLANWNTSPFAREEIELARKNGIPCLSISQAAKAGTLGEILRK